MKLAMILTAVCAILVGCGGSGGAPSEAPAGSATNPPNPAPPSPVSNKLCFEIAGCALSCARMHPFATDQEILRQCAAANIGINSGACLKRQMDNQAAIDSHDACLAKYARDVPGW